MITSILIPTDFSPASWNAARFGIELSSLNSGVKVRFLHIYPMSKRPNGSLGNEDPLIADVQHKMDKLVKDLSGNFDESIENIVLGGDVEEKLIEYIKHNKSDLVIVGVNSNGINNEIGSHTISMIKQSGIPVLIVPNNQMNGALAS